MLFTSRTSARPHVTRAILASAMLAVGLAPPLEAQTQSSQRAVASDQVVNGWIGVAFDVIRDRRGRASYVEIVEVSSGSPAESAGLRRGDRVLAINELEGATELASLTDRLHLNAGDPVVIQIQRDGQRQRLRLEAAPRPDAFTVGRVVRLSLEADSMVETWVRAMDSLRVELIADHDREVRLRAMSSDGRLRLREPSDGSEHRITVVADGSGRTMRVPFEFFVFQGEQHDSLREAMVELDHVVSQLERRIDEREDELRAVLGPQRIDRVHEDAEFRRLTAELSAAEARSAGLETAMAEAGRTTVGLSEPDASWTARRRGTERLWVSSEEEFSPLTPYVLGRNRVAGAEVVELRPELAEYFDVAQGVLVVDVAPGTPAAMAGIVPGDVITRLGRVGVRSVEDLRLGVLRADDALAISLVRQGSSVQVLLRR